MEAVKKTLWTELRWKIRYCFDSYTGVEITAVGYPVLIRRVRPGYRSTSEVDASYYYCPYVPIIKSGIYKPDED